MELRAHSDTFTVHMHSIHKSHAVHGGSFIEGAGNIYSGVSLADGGSVVVVTINYRLGLWGFLPLQEIATKTGDTNGGLLGVHDQIVALQWIRDNIADYGGDPSRVTVFGESAGIRTYRS